MTAKNNASREQHSQLQAILDYYNKESKGTEGLTPIDWADYQDSIHTPNVVKKIKEKYEAFMQAEFNVDGAVAKCGVRTEAMKALDISMHYNYNLWLAHYMTHLDQIETLHNIGDPTRLSMLEMMELNPTVSLYNAGKQEIGDISPSDLVENSTVTRLCTQFSWGSRYNPPFVHSNDSISSVVATLAKLGK